jgi:hypothetical protein
MSQRIRPIFSMVIAALALGFAAKTAAAQDPVTVDPEHYKVLYEDSDVRVLRYDDLPGHVVAKHTHRYPYKVYVLTTATRNFLSLDDKTKECQKLVVVPPAEPVPGATKMFANDELMRPPVTHCEVNTGQVPTHLIIFEFKKQ